MTEDILMRPLRIRLGDGRQEQMQLAEKVRQGTKVATSTSYTHGRGLRVGTLLEIVASDDEEPITVEILATNTCRFADVGLAFAIAEDWPDLQSWRERHRVWLEKFGPVSADTPVFQMVFERIRQVA